MFNKADKELVNIIVDGVSKKNTNHAPRRHSVGGKIEEEIKLCESLLRATDHDYLVNKEKELWRERYAMIGK